MSFKIGIIGCFKKMCTEQDGMADKSLIDNLDIVVSDEAANTDAQKDRMRKSYGADLTALTSAANKLTVVIIISKENDIYLTQLEFFNSTGINSYELLYSTVEKSVSLPYNETNVSIYIHMYSEIF